MPGPTFKAMQGKTQLFYFKLVLQTESKMFNYVVTNAKLNANPNIMVDRADALLDITTESPNQTKPYHIKRLYNVEIPKRKLSL